MSCGGEGRGGGMVEGVGVCVCVCIVVLGGVVAIARVCSSLLFPAHGLLCVCLRAHLLLSLVFFSLLHLSLLFLQEMPALLPRLFSIPLHPFPPLLLFLPCALFLFQSLLLQSLFLLPLLLPRHLSLLLRLSFRPLSLFFLSALFLLRRLFLALLLSLCLFLLQRCCRSFLLLLHELFCNQVSLCVLLIRGFHLDGMVTLVRECALFACLALALLSEFLAGQVLWVLVEPLANGLLVPEYSRAQIVKLLVQLRLTLLEFFRVAADSAVTCAAQIVGIDLAFVHRRLVH
mmetsp:Transcript_35131/g.51481  ORF Transcript_35131/g.51481 Transcript_35131/m.51481 type:complete len:288 (-) Transcript_35131:1289-2152(-)